MNDSLKIEQAAAALYRLEDDLHRYQSEDYLHKEEHSPRVSIVVGNHPTYLRDVEVFVQNKTTRALIKNELVKAMKRQIKVAKKHLDECIEAWRSGE